MGGKLRDQGIKVEQYGVMITESFNNEAVSIIRCYRSKVCKLRAIGFAKDQFVDDLKRSLFEEKCGQNQISGD